MSSHTSDANTGSRAWAREPADNFPEIGQGEDLIRELTEHGESMESMGVTASGLRCPLKLLVKVILFIIRILIRIFLILINPKFGLKEIKREIREIEKRLDEDIVPSIVTTGPVGRNVGVGSIVVKILNNTGVPQTVTVTVYDITECQKIADSQGTVTIPPCCSETFIFCAPIQYEVEVSGLVQGVYVWSAARLQPPVVGVAASVYVATNTFRHKEFVAQVPCPPVNE